MASDLEETNVTYQELEDIEREFEDVEVEIIRQQAQMSEALYEKRQKTVAQIPNFWPLVFESAPQEVDEYIQPSDAALILSSLKALSVSRFEIENGAKGDPRSIAIRFEFTENEYFEDSVVEKKFWYRRALDGWSGLVSEPVEIKWKQDKDLTDGLLSMVKRCWAEEQADPSKAKPTEESDLTAEQTALKEKIENTGMGGISFFAWFGFIGRRISADENRQANEKWEARRKQRLAGEKASEEDEDEDEDEDDEEELIHSLEIFPDGDDLAVAIAEDLWPGAIRYFITAQEQDGMSDMDFEDSEDGDAPDLVEIDERQLEDRPAKKQKK